MLRVTAMLGLSMRFAVVVDGVDLGGWATCAGFVGHLQPRRAQRGRGQRPDRCGYRVASRTPRSPLTRAMTAPDSEGEEVAVEHDRQAQGGTAKITLFDAHNKEVSSWSLQNVLPSSWTGPTLNATSKEIAVEKLELAHEGFL